ncbi:TFIIB-type zinc ribbon-containing protein [Pedobacter yulinensis]
MSERNGIEIDYCPSCRGVWLDRGELDKIIERSAASAQSSTPGADFGRQEPYHGHEREHRDHHKRPHYKKKESFLGDLFDF